MNRFFKFFMSTMVSALILLFMLTNVFAATLEYSYEDSVEDYKTYNKEYVYDPSSCIEGLVNGKAPLGGNTCISYRGNH